MNNNEYIWITCNQLTLSVDERLFRATLTEYSLLLHCITDFALAPSHWGSLAEVNELLVIGRVCDLPVVQIG